MAIHQASLFSIQRLPIVLLVLVCVFTIPAVTDHAFDINPHPSPEASTSLICPNDIPSDCYPSLFQPTIHFQKIRPDQSLPPGLHIRLNIQNGEKEARLNIPEANDRDQDTIVVVDDVHQSEVKALGIVEAESPLQLRLQGALKQEKHARPYSPPRPAQSKDPNELALYESARSIVKEKIVGRRLRASIVTYTSGIAEPLEALTDLAHSLEWGLAICRDVDLVHSLLVSITPANAVEHIDSELRSAVLLLGATAIQNNPDALAALLQHDPHENGHLVALRAALASLALSSSNSRADPQVVARAVFFLSQLCARDSVMETFSSPNVNGLSLLTGIYQSSLSDADAVSIKLRHRIANFMEDHTEQIARLHLSDAFKTDDMLRSEEVRASLQYWCRALSLALEQYKGHNSMGTTEAKQEIDRVLKLYTGEGCREGYESEAGLDDFFN